jgi:tRNA(Met) C34 N-acetyltransferase TmcA
MYQDRTDAAAVLAQRLSHHAGHHSLVLAIPRGAVGMARDIAKTLGCEFDVVPHRHRGRRWNGDRVNHACRTELRKKAFTELAGLRGSGCSAAGNRAGERNRG